MNNKVYGKLLKRVRNAYPDFYDAIAADSKSELGRLFNANPAVSKMVSMHTKKIFPSIAVYKAIISHTNDKDGAYKLISDYYLEGASSVQHFLQTIFKIPNLYKKLPSMMTKLILKYFGTESGFEMHLQDSSKNRCHIDMIKCPYHQNCKECGCEELTTAFCNPDDVSYGRIHPKAKWLRTKTLGRGNECCNFIMEIEE